MPSQHERTEDYEEQDQDDDEFEDDDDAGDDDDTFADTARNAGWPSIAVAAYDLAKAREASMREAFGTVQVGGHPMEFNISLATGEVGRSGWQDAENDWSESDEKDWNKRFEAMGDAYASEVERVLAEVAPDIGWRAPHRRPDATAGPGGLEDVIVLLVQGGALVTGVVGVINIWVTFGKNLRSAWSAIRERFGAEPHVASGTAMALAAAALDDETDSSGFSVAFSTRVGAHPPNQWGAHDAFAVGFRSGNELRVMIVDLDGQVRGTMSVNMPGRLPAVWQQWE